MRTRIATVKAAHEVHAKGTHPLTSDGRSEERSQQREREGGGEENIILLLNTMYQ